MKGRRPSSARGKIASSVAASMPTTRRWGRVSLLPIVVRVDDRCRRLERLSAFERDVHREEGEEGKKGGASAAVAPPPESMKQRRIKRHRRAGCQDRGQLDQAPIDAGWQEKGESRSMHPRADRSAGHDQRQAPGQDPPGDGTPVPM